MTDSLEIEALKSTNYYTFRENMQTALFLKYILPAVEEDSVCEAVDASAKNTMLLKVLRGQKNKPTDLLVSTCVGV